MGGGGEGEGRGGEGGGEGNPSLYTKIGPPLISYIHLSIEIQMEKLISPKIWKFSKLMRPCTANSVLVIFQRCQVTSNPLFKVGAPQSYPNVGLPVSQKQRK
jgi:hypothetical protein